MKKVSLLALALTLSYAAKAQFAFVTNNGAITITRYSGPRGPVTIPATTNGLPVTGIGGNAISGDFVTSLTIPSSITNIAASAFDAPASVPVFTNITVDASNPVYSSFEGVLFDSDRATLLAFPQGKSGSYTVPDGVTSIGTDAFYKGGAGVGLTLDHTLANIEASAFYNCYIAAIAIPDSVTNIADSAFYNSPILNISLGNGVIAIGPSAFSGCSSLTEIVLPNSLSSLGSSAFYNCTKLSNVTILDGITNIGDSAFYKCSSLTNIVLPNSLTSLGGSAFKNCSKLTNIVLPNNINNIASSTFYTCANLTSATIPDSVLSIGDYAFYSCDSLTNVTIPSGLTSIGFEAFAYCPLPSVGIPSTVTNIGPEAFLSCSAIVVETNNAAYSSVDGVLFDKSQTTLIQFPTTREGTYSIPQGVTSIGAAAFYTCTELNQIKLPNTLTNIGTAAFNGCRSLTSLTVPSSVVNIADDEFSYCESLTAMYFQGDAPTIVSPAFWYAPTTVYYLPNTSGWESTFGGAPTALWDPQIQGGSVSFGAGQAGLGFNIVGTTDIPIMVEACTNLSNGSWMPLLTTNLTAGSVWFNDSESTNYPNRFYRLSSP